MISVSIQSQVHVHVTYAIDYVPFDAHTQYEDEGESFSQELKT